MYYNQDNNTPTILPQTLNWGTFSANNDGIKPVLIFSNTLRLNFTGLTENTTYNWTVKVQKGLPNTSALSKGNFTTGSSETTYNLNVYLTAGLYNAGNTYFFGLAEAVTGGDEGIQIDFAVDSRVTLDTNGGIFTGELVNQAFSYSGEDFDITLNRLLDEKSLELNNITIFDNTKIPTNLAVKTFVENTISGFDLDSNTDFTDLKTRVTTNEVDIATLSNSFFDKKIESSEETLTGLLNGVNTVFTTTSPYKAESLSVYLNGQRLVLTNQYVETDPTTGSFTLTVAPVSTDVLAVEYLTSSNVGVGGGGGGGEINTASNLGTGEGVFAQKTGADLNFKSLVGSDDIIITSDQNQIYFNKNTVLSEATRTGVYIPEGQTTYPTFTVNSLVNTQIDIPEHSVVVVYTDPATKQLVKQLKTFTARTITPEYPVGESPLLTQNVYTFCYYDITDDSFKFLYLYKYRDVLNYINEIDHLIFHIAVTRSLTTGEITLANIKYHWGIDNGLNFEKVDKIVSKPTIVRGRRISLAQTPDGGNVGTYLRFEGGRIDGVPARGSGNNDPYNTDTIISSTILNGANPFVNSSLWGDGGAGQNEGNLFNRFTGVGARFIPDPFVAGQRVYEAPAGATQFLNNASNYITVASNRSALYGIVVFATSTDGTGTKVFVIVCASQEFLSLPTTNLTTEKDTILAKIEKDRVLHTYFAGYIGCESGFNSTLSWQTNIANGDVKLWDKNGTWVPVANGYNFF